MSIYIGPYFIGKLPKTTQTINVFGCEKCQTEDFSSNSYCGKCGSLHINYNRFVNDFVNFYEYQTEIDEVHVCSAEHHHNKSFDGYFVALPNKKKNISTTALSTTSVCDPYRFESFSIDPSKIQDDLDITRNNHQGFIKNLDDAGIDVEIKWGIVEY